MADQKTANVTARSIFRGKPNKIWYSDIEIYNMLTLFSTGDTIKICKQLAELGNPPESPVNFFTEATFAFLKMKLVLKQNYSLTNLVNSIPSNDAFFWLLSI
jgi:hypothetical protein